MQVGMTKDQGLYSKPSAAVHPGALATGTVQQYNTKKYVFHNCDAAVDCRCCEGSTAIQEA